MHSPEIIATFGFGRFSAAQTIGVVLLGGPHAVAAIAGLGNLVTVKPFGVSVFGSKDAAVGCESNHAAVALRAKCAESRFGGKGAADAVGVDETLRAVFEIHVDNGAILGSDHRVEACRAAVNRTDIAGEETERVQVMHQDFVNQKARHGAEVWLHHVWFRPSAVAGSHLGAEM